MSPVANWRIIAGGFLQKNTDLNGSVGLWRKAHERFADPGTVVQFVPWDTSPGELAEFILQLDRQSQPPDIRIAGYSWGGAVAARLAHQLDRRGLKVHRLILCDPVYRHGYWLGNWRAFLNWIPIPISDNVGMVDHLHQDQSHPRGHLIECQGKRTVIRSSVKLEMDHVWCDDSPIYHDLVLSTFGEP